MTIEQPKEYEQEKKAISEEYEEKGNKRFNKWLISILIMSVLAVSSSSMNYKRSNQLEKNYPIHQTYVNNQNSLEYLRNRLNQYKPEKFPEFLSKDIKNELENISVQEDTAKISSLEKVVKIAEQDNIRIVNTFEFKEYSEKREKIEKNNRFFLLGLMGLAFASLSTYFFTNQSSRRCKDKEFKALDKRHGLIPEEPKDSTQSSQ